MYRFHIKSWRPEAEEEKPSSTIARGFLLSSLLKSLEPLPEKSIAFKDDPQTCAVAT